MGADLLWKLFDGSTANFTVYVPKTEKYFKILLQ